MNHVVKRFGMLRDNQAKKLYTAERVLKPFSQRVERISDIEAFIKRVKGKATIQRRYSFEFINPIEIEDGRGCTSARGSAWGIKMPVWSRTEYIVLHELAHVVSIRQYGKRYIAPHGWEYCAVYLDLVRFVLGKEAGEALKASFKAHRVRFTKPTTRKLTDEQRAALTERMAHARAAKKIKLAA